MDLAFYGPWIPLVVEATLLTLLLAALSLIGSIVVGVTIAVLRRFAWRWVNAIVIVVVNFVRGTPLLVQLLAWYLVPPVAFGVDVGVMEAAVIGLSVNGGAFLSEIIRGALKSVPKGQIEAGSALGFGRLYILRTIELPQAMPVILPAAISFFIGLIKDTSIAYIVGLHELTKTSQLITMSEPSNTFEIYLIAGVIYFCICFSLSRVGLRLEDRYKRSGVYADRVGV